MLPTESTAKVDLDLSVVRNGVTGEDSAEVRVSDAAICHSISETQILDSIREGLVN